MAKIVFSSNTAFSLYNFRLPLMRRLKEMGHTVFAVAPEDKYSHRLRQEFEFFSIKNLDRKGKNPIKDLKLTLEYLRIYKKTKPDLVVNFTIKPNIYSSICAGLLGIPSISVVTGLGYAFIEKTWLTDIVKNLYKIAFFFNTFVVFLNREDIDLLKRLAKNKAVLIESEGVDTEFFSPKHCEEKTSEDFTFLFVGRLLKDKDVYELVRAFEELKKEFPGVRLAVVGDVDEGNPASVKKQEIEEWERMGLIEWFGFQEDVRPYHCMADCVVLPSYYREGIPRVLLEAMAMERPIITTDSVGCRDVCVDGVNGFLVEPKSWESLYEAMKRMVELSPYQRKAMGAKGRNFVLEKYDIKLVVSKYLELIEKVKIL